MSALAILCMLCFLAVGYAYFGYPLILAAANLLRSGRVSAPPTPLPSGKTLPVTVLITVRNEIRVIREKLEQTMALNYAGSTVEQLLARRDPSMQLIVASDASDDGTDEAVREFAARGVELVRLAVRGGKEKAQHEAIKHARGEFIAFTDAKIRLNQEALDYFAAHLQDPAVGSVSSVDRVEVEPGESSGEGFYVRYEMWLRSLESYFLSLVGLSGSCFAVRRSLCANLATDIPSDFALLLETRRAGLRGRHAPEVIGSYRAVKTEKEEFTRKVRTVVRGINTLFMRAELLNPLKYGLFAFQVISHKLSRWMVPWFFLAGTAAAFLLAPVSGWFSVLSLALAAFFILAAIGGFVPSCRSKVYCKVPLFFLVSNAAIAVAWIKYFSGQRAVLWEPSAKGGPA